MKLSCLPQLHCLSFHVCLMKYHGYLQQKQSRRYSFIVTIIRILIVGTPHQPAKILRERLQVIERISKYMVIYALYIFSSDLLLHTNFDSACASYLCEKTFLGLAFNLWFAQVDHSFVLYSGRSPNRYYYCLLQPITLRVIASRTSQCITPVLSKGK
jgi:hypothetical protein